MLSTRMLAGIGDADERVTISALTEKAACDLLGRMHPDGVRLWHRIAAPVREAARRPLFAIALAVLVSERPEWAPAAPGEIIDRLVRRSLGRDWITSHAVLADLAVRSLERDGAAVRPGDVVSPHALEALLASRIVVEERGRLRFPLIIFAQWFAAHAVLEERVDIQGLLADVPRLELWRYPLAIALSVGAHERVDDISDALTREQPGFASIVLDEAVAQLGIQEASDMHDPLDAGRRIRRATAAWMDGLGPLAPLIMPFDGDAVPPLGIARHKTQLLTTWWCGEEQRPEVFPIEMPESQPLPEGWGTTWLHRPAAGVAWPWVWARDALLRDLEDLVQRRALPMGGSPLEPEAAWQVRRACCTQRTAGSTSAPCRPRLPARRSSSATRPSTPPVCERSWNATRTRPAGSRTRPSGGPLGQLQHLSPRWRPARHVSGNLMRSRCCRNCRASRDHVFESLGLASAGRSLHRAARRNSPRLRARAHGLRRRGRQALRSPCA